MDPTEAALIGLFFAVVMGTLVYALVRLWRSKETERLDATSQKLARATGAPKFLDPLLARPMTSREKCGWVLFFGIAIAAITLTGK